MSELQFDTGEMVRFLVRLLNTPSPTGWSDDAMAVVEDAFRALNIEDLRLERTPKGALIITWPGVSADAPRGLTAHADTLGLMVKEIKPNGRLKLVMIGNYMWNAVEFEGVTVQTFGGRRIRGTVVPAKASTHIYGLEAGEVTRSQDTMELRLDELISNADDVRALGIEVGDFVFVDPRTEVGEAGFVRSRHLDNKAGVATIYGAFRALKEAGSVPTQTVTALMANYEEVGHGGSSGFPADLHEMVTVDMAVVGDGQNADEFSVGLCARDTGGAYHPVLTRKLRLLAEEHAIAYRMDVYLRYGSDGEAYWRSGGSAQVALIGPGVEASHAYERTHRDSLTHTAHLIARFMLS
ncbi:MAG TPA: M42 family metallopeptidase [Aggregatilinea sp.]|uniref:M42 family metallopeptidase n=1 Tax=Aggregatilinea sp. TaxID=2806333 RepID=UPI002C4997BD|nr:M42 family metallopeptidase [Aggregatilinea sp.]HML20386.1 M42 family metallopeptidase [Aggregatilinea sp.]